MHRNRSVNVHQFSMVPRTDIPRAGFRIENTHKTTFNAGRLIPVYCEEVLPGDTFSLKATIFARLATPIVPVMDNLYLETFFFFVPNRLVWDNWQKFCGERTTPAASIDYVVQKLINQGMSADMVRKEMDAKWYAALGSTDKYGPFLKTLLQLVERVTRK